MLILDRKTSILKVIKPGNMMKFVKFLINQTFHFQNDEEVVETCLFIMQEVLDHCVELLSDLDLNDQNLSDYELILSCHKLASYMETDEKRQHFEDLYKKAIEGIFQKFLPESPKMFFLALKGYKESSLMDPEIFKMFVQGLQMCDLD